MKALMHNDHNAPTATMRIPGQRLPHVLLLDDEAVILQILAAVFETEPVRTSLATNADAACRILQEQSVDLLITDKNLPDRSGLDVIRFAKAKDPLCEVILITGYASIDTAIEALTLGAFDYIRKPLDDVFDISRKARRALERRQLAQDNQRLLVELKENNRALEKALMEARELSAELIQSEKLAGVGTLAAGIAHEISSPLFGILGLAEAIVDEDQLPTAQAHAKEIVEYCSTIRDIVQELTSYSRTEDGEEDGALVELGQAVADAVRLVQRTVPCEGVEIVRDLGDKLYVGARQNELQQVFVNLVKNAVEAIREYKGRGTVQISAQPSGNWVIVDVQDDGPGIPEARQRQVFDPFYTTKPPGKGTGLGLNVVYRIITRFHGNIEVSSRLGQGTRFRLRLPVSERSG
jgi:C4-dicarboxylate-specific signal transduction histidine kinase